MNFIDGFINILQIFGAYYSIGLSFIGLLPKKKISRYFSLVIIFGYSLSFFGAPLSRRGFGPNEIVLTFLGFILFGLIYSILTNKILTILKNFFSFQNLILLSLFLVSAGILLYIPTSHTGNMAPFSHGNNDPWFFVSRAEVLSRMSFKNVPPEIVADKPALSGITLGQFMETTAFQLGSISNILNTDPFWLFNSFRVFLHAASFFAIYFLFKKYFKISFRLSLLAGLFFAFHTYNIYIYYQGFLKQFLGYSGFVVYPILFGQIIKNKTWPFILPLFGYLIYAKSYTPVLAITVFFSLIFLFVYLVEIDILSSFKQTKHLIRRYAKYFLVLIPLIFGIAYSFLTKYAFLGSIRDNLSEVGYLFPNIFEIFGITAFRNPFFKFPPSIFSYLILFVFLILLLYSLSFSIKKYKKNRLFIFLAIGLIFLIITIPYVYLISNLNTKFLAFRFYSFISPLILTIFIGPIFLIRKYKSKNILLSLLTIILFFGYLNGIYNQFKLRGKPDLSMKNKDISMFKNLDDQCLSEEINLDVDFGGHWDQLWSTYLLKNCQLSLTKPTPKHIVKLNYDPLKHTFLAEGESDYSLIYKTDQDYYPIYKQGEKFQIVDLSQTEKILSFQGNTFGREFGMFNKDKPFYWLGEEGKYFIKIYSPVEGIQPVNFNLNFRNKGTVEIKTKPIENESLTINAEQNEKINRQINLELTKGWNYIIVDNQAACSVPESDSRCLSIAIQIE